jgi:hypothetical protein
VLLGV